MHDQQNRYLQGPITNRELEEKVLRAGSATAALVVRILAAS